MAKNYVTLTVEFKSDAPWDDVVRNLISRIGNLDNDELGYTVTKVHNSLFGIEHAYDEDEEWYND
jgi:hypothetical protein